MIAFPRRRYTAIAAVAIAATVLFGVGYAIGGRDSPPAAGADGRDDGPRRCDGLARRCCANDEAGNWPMTIAVTGLPPLPKGKTLRALADEGRQARRSVRRLRRRRGHDEVPLNAPYR